MAHTWDWSGWEDGWKLDALDYSASTFATGKNITLLDSGKGVKLAPKSLLAYATDGFVISFISLGNGSVIALDDVGNIYYNGVKKYTLQATDKRFVAGVIFRDYVYLFTTNSIHRILFGNAQVGNISASTVVENVYTYAGNGIYYRPTLNWFDTALYIGAGKSVHVIDANGNLATPLTVQSTDIVMGLTQVGSYIRVYTYGTDGVMCGKLHLWDGKSPSASQSIIWRGTPVRGAINAGKYDIIATGASTNSGNLEIAGGYDRSFLGAYRTSNETYTTAHNGQNTYMGSLNGILLRKQLSTGNAVMIPFVKNSSKIELTSARIGAVGVTDIDLFYSYQHTGVSGYGVEQVVLAESIAERALSGEVQSAVFFGDNPFEKKLIKQVRIWGEIPAGGGSITLFVRAYGQTDWKQVGVVSAP